MTGMLARGFAPSVAPLTRSKRRAHARARIVRTRAFSLVPKTPKDAIARHRAVLLPLFTLGAALHAPDLLGRGIVSHACDATSFATLTPFGRGVTALWVFGGGATAAALASGTVWADVGVLTIALVEIASGTAFSEAIAPVEMPTPIVIAQCVNVAAVVGFRSWERVEADSTGAEAR